MRGARIMKAGGLAALATALTLVTVPASAQERGQGHWRGGGGDAPAVQGGASPRGSNWRGGNGGGSGEIRGGEVRGGESGGGRSMGWRGGGQPQVQAPAVQAPAPSQVQAERRGWNGNGNRNGNWANGNGRDGRDVVEGRSNVPPAGNPARYRYDDNTNRWRSDSANANRWRNDDANRWRSDTPDANRWRGDGRNYAWRGDRNDNTWRGDRQNWAGNRNGNWNRDWRRDDRFDWRGYRSANRDVYRLGAYYAPYRNYSYRRLTAGFTLDAMFFGSRYWIDDPYQYRLPPAYGPYRWVRYYDDALLVDTYSGEVVDAIYDFFW